MATPARWFLSPGRAIGLRLVPTVRDLRFAWEEMPQQTLDAQQQKVRESSARGTHRLGAGDRRRSATTGTTCPASACTRSATGMKSRTSCGTERWRRCWPNAQHSSIC